MSKVDKQAWCGYSLDELKANRASVANEVEAKRDEIMQRVNGGVSSFFDFSPAGIVRMFTSGSSFSPLKMVEYFLLGWRFAKTIRRIINIVVRGFKRGEA